MHDLHALQQQVELQEVGFTLIQVFKGQREEIKKLSSHRPEADDAMEEKEQE